MRVTVCRHRPRHTRVRVRDVIYFLNIGQEAPSGVEAR
jgi:hypothetical protein